MGPLKGPVQYSPTIDRWERFLVEQGDVAPSLGPCAITSRGMNTPEPPSNQQPRRAHLMWSGCNVPRGFTLGNALVVAWWGREKSRLRRQLGAGT